MKTAKQTPAGALTILLEFDPYTVQGAKLSVPMLGIEEHITQFTQYERIPAGSYSGIITTFLASGDEQKQNVKLRVLPNQGNLHEFKLAGPAQEILIRPVDSENRTILYSEIKVDDVDLNFRPVRDEQGIVCRLRPGEYTVQVILPNLQIKTLPLRVTSDTQFYSLMIADKHTETRREPRVFMRVPVEYRTNDGHWISTETVNLSATGVCLIKRRWNLEDEEMLLRLFVPVSPAPLECPARVRWVKDEGAANARIGLELLLTGSMKILLKKWLASNGKRSAKV